MFDKNKILSKLNFIKQSKTKLDELKSLKKEEFLADFTYFDSAKYNLVVAIEAIIDICNHIISRKNFEIPATSADSIKILVKHKILPREYQDIFIAMVKFRNRVVHLYHEVDDEEIYKIIQENLNDIDVFIALIIKLIK
jgi:uncharacterized protein YutE (UPF0331/DUF86 family)